MLHGHERSITKIRYNADGDLLFSASKDNTPNVWFSINGERFGTLDGHTGAVWSIDGNCKFRLLFWTFIYNFINIGDSSKVATGSADATVRLWDCESGKCLNTIETVTSVRSVLFSYSGKLLLYTTDAHFGKDPEINVIDITSGEHLSGQGFVTQIKEPSFGKAISSLWGPVDESVITGHESGAICKWDLRNPTQTFQESSVHKSQVNDLQYNKDQLLFISASKDHTAKVCFDLVGKCLF